MRRILVTGAGGFIGGHVCEQLAASSAIRAASRRSFSCIAPSDGLEHCSVDIAGAATDWDAAVAGVDAVVHLAARAHILGADAARNLEAFRVVNVEGTRSLTLASIRAGVRRLVMVSTVKAMGGETTGNQCYSEDSPCHPSDPYGVSKWEAEQVLRETAAGQKMEVVILRAPLVYGPGVGANFLRLLRALDRGIPMPFGLVNNKRSLLFVGNLVSAIAHCLDRPAAGGQVFLVADDNVLSTRELMLQLSKLMGRSLRLLPIPIQVLHFGGRILRRSDDVRRLTGSLLVSTTKIQQRLDWHPPFTVSAGLCSTVAWYQSSKR